MDKSATIRIASIYFILQFSTIFIHAQKQFWGVVHTGGAGFSIGVIYSTDSTGGNYQIVKKFDICPAGNPTYNCFVEGQGGKLYGMTPFDAFYSLGSIFEWDTTTRKVTSDTAFNDCSIGCYPNATLALRPNGNFLGFTPFGGSGGRIFNYDPVTNTRTLLANFPGLVGANPYGSPLLCSDSNYYGTSIYSAHTSGLLFRFDPDSSIVVPVHVFDSIDGQSLCGTLMHFGNDKIIGMASEGGSMNYGTIYSYDIPNDTFQKLFDFDSLNTGSHPYGALIQVSNGKMYGLTLSGGSADAGTLFEFDTTNNTVIKLFDFLNDSTTGMNPYGSLVEAPNGMLIGMSSAGGRFNLGTLFEFDPIAHQMISIISFEGYNGGYAKNSLIKASNNKIYGYSNFTIFEYDYNTHSILNRDVTNSINGYLPDFKLTKHGNILYGLTSSGGYYGKGGIYSIDPVTHQFTVHFAFNDTICRFPSSALLSASDGFLYGTAGNAYLTGGYLFRFDPLSNILDTIYHFDGTNGEYPKGDIIESGLKIYGTVSSGANQGRGGIYSYDLTNDSLKMVVEFSNFLNGTNPELGVTDGSNGMLYMASNAGGTNYFGAILKYEIATGDTVKVHEFSGPDGQNIRAPLTLGHDGNLYGVAYQGGTHNNGTLFRIDGVTDAFTKLVDFDSSTTGMKPSAQLLSASNGKLYGTSAAGGANGVGMLFEYDIVSNIITPLQQMIDTIGKNPEEPMIEINVGTILGIHNYENKNNHPALITDGIVRLPWIAKVLKTEIYDSQSNRIMEFLQKPEEINLASYPAGFYFVKIISEKSPTVYRIIKM